MPRNRRGGSLASYFYDAAGDGVGSLHSAAAKMTGVRTNEIMLNPNTFLGPTVNRKGKRSRSQPPNPGGAAPQTQQREPTRKHMVKEMQQHLATMKKHFKETENIYEAHKAWPLNPIYEKIQQCIDKCKLEIRNARTHTGTGRHIKNVQAIHATRIDTSGWGLKAIHDAITQYVYQAPHNHLTLQTPHHHEEGTHMYVNVVLAWLFAAKRQLMSNLTVYIDQAYNKTPAMQQFLTHERSGRQALADYHRIKAQLPPKKRKSLDLADSHTLDEQHRALYG